MHPIFPADSEGNIKMKPVGYVKVPDKGPRIRGMAEIEAEIIVNSDGAKCLDGIEEFSHILVVYWLDRIKKYRGTCHPQDKEEVPLLGLLATR